MDASVLVKGINIQFKYQDLNDLLQKQIRSYVEEHIIFYFTGSICFSYKLCIDGLMYVPCVWSLDNGELMKEMTKEITGISWMDEYSYS